MYIKKNLHQSPTFTFTHASVNIRRTLHNINTNDDHASRMRCWDGTAPLQLLHIIKGTELTSISSSGTLDMRSNNSLLGTECGRNIRLKNLFVPHSINRYLIGMKYSTKQADTSNETAIHDK